MDAHARSLHMEMVRTDQTHRGSALGQRTEPCRLFGLHWLVPVIPAALAIVLTLRDVIA